jgi:transcriptional regulator with XRE-family HTH domain
LIVDFSTTLRERRVRRQLSQLDLASRAGTSQRHISFLESGRSAPGRAMVLRLADSLDLPLRERNTLLLAAGFAPVYAESPLDSPELAPVRDALEHVLRGYAPYPAIVIDRSGHVVAANTAFDILTEGVRPDLLRPPVNVYRLALHPQGMAPRIRNFAQWSRHVVVNLHQAQIRNPDPRLAELHAELERYVPTITDDAEPLGFAVPLQLATPHGDLRLVTTVSTFATATDVTVSELRLEAFLPVDEASTAVLRGLSEPGRTVGAFWTFSSSVRDR